MCAWAVWLNLYWLGYDVDDNDDDDNGERIGAESNELDVQV